MLGAHEQCPLLVGLVPCAARTEQLALLVGLILAGRAQNSWDY